ncbi:MAG TPA: hypothetical protein ENO07_07855, partial [candidate division Zixibacteria bacterium]|nr:hypothetical protein [candidate division Zixibacteria bacterium]
MRFRNKYIIPILIFAVLLILFFNLGQWYIFSQVRDFAESVFRENLLAQAELAASSFNGDAILSLQGDDFYAPDLIDIKDRLDRLKDDYDFFNVRLLDLDAERLLGFADYDTASFIFDYDLGPFISASAGIPAASDLITARDMYLISAYAPITTSLDSVVAVLGIDADYTFFKSLA